MTNVLIGIKRFFTNKNTVAIFTVIVCVAILYFAYNYRINKATDPVNIPYAVREISARTLITSDMVAVKKVPGGVVGKGNVVKNTNMIVGKYVTANTTIPKGSLFYSETLTSDWTEAKSSLYDDIPNGNTLVSLSVSLESTYGNSIFPGNYIDLYYVGVENGKLMLGKFIESIMVLGVIDSYGNNIFEKSSFEINSPAYLVFSVPEEYYLLLEKTNYLSGNVFPVPRNASYSNNPKVTSISSSYIQNYILNQTINVASMDEKKVGGGVVINSNKTGGAN